VSGTDMVELFLWGCFALYRNWKEVPFWKIIKILNVKISHHFHPWNQWLLLRVWFVFLFQGRSFTHEENWGARHVPIFSGIKSWEHFLERDSAFLCNTDTGMNRTRIWHSILLMIPAEEIVLEQQKACQRGVSPP